jgi:hypothetical protein
VIDLQHVVHGDEEQSTPAAPTALSLEQSRFALAAYWAALDEATDPADAERRLRELVGELERPHSSAAACLTEDLPALCTHLKYFPRLRKRFRSSNLLERSLEEVKRRTKVIGRSPGETSCLSMCWAMLDLFLSGARGLGFERPGVQTGWLNEHRSRASRANRQ